jgi:hypothetical protein
MGKEVLSNVDDKNNGDYNNDDYDNDDGSGNNDNHGKNYRNIDNYNIMIIMIIIK